MTLDYLLTLMTFCGIYSILALSLNILIGFAGQVSLGHAAFFGIGAYASAIFTVKLGLSYWISLPLSILISAFFGFLLGLPSLRVKHDFLVLATIGMNFVVVSLFNYISFFGGPYGIVGIPRPSLFGHTLMTIGYFLYTLFWVVLVTLFVRYLTKKYVRYGFEAIKEDEWAAESIGVSVPRFKIYAFTIAGALAGLAGNLWAHQMGAIFPDNFSFPVSISILTMVVLGGIGTIIGPIVGAVLLTILPEILRFVQDYRMFIYGAIVVLLMLYQPSGLLGKGGILRRLVAR